MEFSEVYNTIHSQKNLIRRELPIPIGGFRPSGGVQPTEENVEDVVQESLITAWQRLEEFDPSQSSLATWCGWIVRGECANYKRVEATEPTGGDFGETLGGDDPLDVSLLEDDYGALTLIEKMMVDLYATGYSINDIASILYTNHNSISTRLNQIKNKWNEKN